VDRCEIDECGVVASLAQELDRVLQEALRILELRSVAGVRMTSRPAASPSVINGSQ